MENTKNHFNRKHGEANKTKEYKLWVAIKDRCHNPKCKVFDRYGGRGLFMHEAWRNNYATFIRYIIITIGRAPSVRHTMERKDNNKGYVPGNLKWCLMREQTQNRNTTRYVPYNGNQICLAKLAQQLNFDYRILWKRVVRDKMTVDQALIKPLIKGYEKILLLDTSTGIFYDSLALASRIFSIPETTLRRYISNERPNKTNLISV